MNFHVFRNTKGCFLLLLLLWFISPTSAQAQPPVYPDNKPEVTEIGNSLTVLFPQRVGVIFRRTDNQFLSGMLSIWVDSRELLSMPNEYILPPELIFVGDGEVGGVQDWQAYLAKRLSNGFQWPQLGGRALEAVPLDSAEYLGYAVKGDTVILKTRISAFGETGELHWLLVPTELVVGTTLYHGIGWKVRLYGLESAMTLKLIEPIYPQTGDWVLAQTWGHWIEHIFNSEKPLELGPLWYFADMQPFYFGSGTGGTVISYFQDVIANRVEIIEEASRLFTINEIPLGAGTVRETPLKQWLYAERSMTSKWDVINEWTAIFDRLGDGYRKALGLGRTRPKPTIVWGVPEEGYFERYHRGEVDTYWLDDFRTSDLPDLAKLGFRVVYFHTPWESDADHPPADYLPGSGSFGSGNAPWSFEVSPAIGGRERLKAVIDRAHELGVRIVLWSSPGHLSNSSDLLAQNLDWIKWRNTGVPEDFDWGDVTGVSQRSGYFDYAIQEYRRTHADLGYDGIWQDSFLTFGVIPDFREKQPRPTLRETVAMQQEFWQLGMTEVHIEGCGPLGLSTGGFGHEPPIPADLEPIRGREYGLYNYVADNYPDPEVYFRALASGGAVGIANLAELSKIPQEHLDRIQQANFDFLEVMDFMQFRKLIGSGPQWLGVEWRNDRDDNLVLFSFAVFDYDVAAGTPVKDVTQGEVIEVDGVLKTQPFHTYLIGAAVTGVESRPALTFQLAQNYPNPFNPETVIRYQIPQSSRVELAIYDVLGRRVRLLVDRKQPAGRYAVSWDGRNDQGKPVAAGIYLYRLKSGDRVQMQRMVLLR